MFNGELHEKYQESFREEKLLIEKRNGKKKNNLKHNKYINELSLNVTNILVVLIRKRNLHILYLLKEKKETYHRKTLFSLTGIKAKRYYHQRNS